MEKKIARVIFKTIKVDFDIKKGLSKTRDNFEETMKFW